MSNSEFIWTVKLDWLEILQELDLESIDQIPEYKKHKALKNINEVYGTKTLMELEPSELDNLVAEELKEVMKKELTLKEKKEKKLKEELSSKVIPLKKGGIIRLNPKDFKDLDLDGNPEEILKHLYKKFMSLKDKDEDEKDEEDDKRYKEDNTGYYI
ncbi:MAG: hypothetical protein BAJALOKI2v1_140030 [Promethearchaeota archaeon]|nr:MAG: hypothetical protein BAJALOKI2v1_140030 [Candidatus Lokiarchaeota archaeon]